MFRKQGFYSSDVNIALINYRNELNQKYNLKFMNLNKIILCIKELDDARYNFNKEIKRLEDEINNAICKDIDNFAVYLCSNPKSRVEMFTLYCKVVDAKKSELVKARDEILSRNLNKNISSNKSYNQNFIFSGNHNYTNNINMSFNLNINFNLANDKLNSFNNGPGSETVNPKKRKNTSKGQF